MGVITLTGLADQSIQVSKAFVRLDNRIHRVFSSHFSPLYQVPLALLSTPDPPNNNRRNSGSQNHKPQLKV
jgi:hypothetical protein